MRIKYNKYNEARIVEVEPHDAYMSYIRSKQSIYTPQAFVSLLLIDASEWVYTIPRWTDKPTEVFRRSRMAASIAFEAIPKLRER